MTQTIADFIRDLAQRAEAYETHRQMWMTECERICTALEDLAKVPHDPRPGWINCIAKIKGDLAQRAGKGFTVEEIERYFDQWGSDAAEGFRYIRDKNYGIGATTKRLKEGDPVGGIAVVTRRKKCTTDK